MADAIARTLYRLFVSRRHLLEWITAAQSNSRRAPTGSGFYRPDGGQPRRSRRWPRWSSGTPAARRCRSRRPSSLAWLLSPGDRALGQPCRRPTPAAWRSRAADARALRLGRAAHLALLRDLRHRGRPHAAAGQFPGGSRRRSSRTARRRPISACYLLSTAAPATSAGSARSRPSSASRRRSRRWSACSASAATSTTGTTRRDLRPLDPRYVSSVDSGNLAGAPDRARQRLRGMARRPRRRDGDRRRRGRQPGARARGAAGAARRPAHAPRHARSELAGAAATILPRPLPRLSRTGWTTWRCTPATAADLARTLASERGRCRERATCCSGSRPRSGRSRATAATSRRTPRRSAALERRLQTIEATARAMANAMEFDFLLDRERQLLVDRLSRRRGRARPELLRPARLRGAARQLRRDRQGRRAGRALVPARPRGDAGRARRGADLLVGLDVRVPDAVAGHARAARQPARADQPPDRAPADRLRRRPRRAVGHLRIGLQRARPGAHLPVLQLRRAGPRPQARPERERRHRALRHGARRHGRSGGGGGQLRAAGRASAGAAATASTRRSTSRRAACRRARPGRSCAPTWPTTRA